MMNSVCTITAFLLIFSILACGRRAIMRNFTPPPKEDSKLIRLRLAQSWDALQGIPIVGSQMKEEYLDFCMFDGTASVSTIERGSLSLCAVSPDTLTFDYRSDDLRLIGQFLLPPTPTTINVATFDPISYDAAIRTEVYYEPYRIGKWIKVDERAEMLKYGNVSFLSTNRGCEDEQSKWISARLNNRYNGVSIFDKDQDIELCLTEGKEEHVDIGGQTGVFRLDKDRVHFKYASPEATLSIQYAVSPMPAVEYRTSLDTLTKQVQVSKEVRYDLYELNTHTLSRGQSTEYVNKASFSVRPNSCDSLVWSIHWR